MKIAHINATCNAGSTGRLVRDLHEYALQHGCESRVYYGADRSSYPGAFPIVNRFGQVRHALASRLTGIQGHGSVAETKRLIRELEVYKPDIVNLHNMHSNYINYPIMLKWLADSNIATVLVLHDCWFFTGKCTHPAIAGCVHWQDTCCHCPQLRSDKDNPTWIFDRTHTEFEEKKNLFGQIPRLGVIGVSDWILGEARKSFLGRESARLVRIYNWVDTEVFKPLDGAHREAVRESLGISTRIRMYLAVCPDLSDRKGYPFLCAVAKRLLPSECLVVVGDNPHGKPVPDGLHLIGRIGDPRRMAELYSAADACLNVTRAETFGLVTTEALSCGTQVVVNPNTASPELVEPGCGIVLGEDNDADEALGHLRSSSLTKSVSTIDLCMRSAQRFSKDNRCAEYLDFYTRMLGCDWR